MVLNDIKSQLKKRIHEFKLFFSADTKMIALNKLGRELSTRGAVLMLFLCVTEQSSTIWTRS